MLFYDHDSETMLTKELYWTELTLQREFITCKEAGIEMRGSSSSPFLTYCLAIESVLPSIRDDIKELFDEQVVTEVVWVIHRDGYSLIAPSNDEVIESQARRMVAERFSSV